MNHRKFVLFWSVLLVALTGAACGDKSNPSSATAASGSGGTGGMAATTTSASGGDSSSSTGGSGPSWPPGPGKPGKIVEVGRDLPFMSMGGQRSGLLPMNKKIDFVDQLGMGGMGGGSGASCTDYSPQMPTMDPQMSGVELGFSIQPRFEPFSDDCAESRESIAPGELYVTDMMGNVTGYDVFTEADDTSFFGRDNPLPINTKLNLDGQPVSLISGLITRIAVCGTKVYVLTNASTKIIEVDTTKMAGMQRADFEVGSIGLSGIMCWDNGKVLFSTGRTFTVDSWDSAGGGNDPSALVQAAPIALKVLDPAMGSVTTLAEIPATTIDNKTVYSRVITQSSTPFASMNGVPTAFFMAGTANAIALDEDTGEILFNDYLNGSLWRISADGVTKTLVFTSASLFTGFIKAPNGELYVVKNAVADSACASIEEAPAIAVYDSMSGMLGEWTSLMSADYSAVLAALCNTGVIVRNGGANGNKIILGSDFNDLAYGSNPELYLALPLQSKVLKIEISQDEGAGGAGGAGGGM